MLYFESKRTKDAIYMKSIAFGQLRIQTVLDRGFYRPHMTRDPNLHRHLNHELYFVESGSFTALCTEKEYACREDEVLLISADTDHCVSRMSEGAALSSLRCSFYPRRDEKSPLYEALLSRLKAPIHIKDAQKLIRITQAIRDELVLQKEFCEEKLEGLLMIFYAELLRLLLDSSSDSAEDASTVSKRPFPRQKSFCEDTPEEFYMEIMDEFFTHLPLENSTLSELSERLCLSVSQTQRLIKHYYGVSFREKLIQSKILKSIRLITATNEPLEEIAQKVGYDSYNAFFEAFTAFTGKTPSAYKKERRP